MHIFTSLSKRRKEQDMAICLNGRIMKKKKRKRRIRLLVSHNVLLLIHVYACMYVCVCVCDIGKVRVVY